MQGNLLVVDDEKNILNGVERAIAGADMALLKANSAKEALRVIREQEIASL
jgi:DNA-binding NtrC family response regulator